MLRSIILLVLTCLFQLAFSQTQITVRESILRSKANNPFLKTLKFDLDVAQSDVTTAGLRLNPDFQTQLFTIPQSKYWADNTGYLNSANTQSWFQLGMPFRLKPIRKYATDVANKNLSATQQNILEFERTLVLDVCNIWLDAWSFHVNMEILSQAKLNIDTLIKINENRLKNEVITVSELIRTQVLSEQYALQLRTIEQDLFSQLRKLQLITGSTDSIALDYNDEFIFTQPLPLLDSLISLSLIKRNDLQTAKANKNAAQSNVTLQHAFVYPNLYGSAFINPQNSIPYVGLTAGIQIPIFDRNQGGIERSKALLKQTRSNVLALEANIKTEVKNAHAAYLIRKGNLQRFQNIMQQSETVLNTIKYKYLKGNTTIIDFLEAQRTALETKRMYFDEVLSYRKSNLLLLYTSGLINDL